MTFSVYVANRYLGFVKYRHVCEDPDPCVRKPVLYKVVVDFSDVKKPILLEAVMEFSHVRKTILYKVVIDFRMLENLYCLSCNGLSPC
jgi:hypothetical protein